MKLRALTLAAVAGGFVLRWLWLPRGPEGWDAVDFLFALEAYDLSRFQPHFPGYPLYVLAAKGIHLLGVSPEVAYRGLNSAAGALLVLPLAALLPRPALLSRPGKTVEEVLRVLVAVVVTLVPALLIGSQRIESDICGLLLILFGFQLARGERPAAAAFLGGLAVGVRGLGAAPLLMGLLAYIVWARRSREDPPRRDLAGALGVAIVPAFAGILLWWLPQVLFLGWQYFEEGRYFLLGHFSDWGGSAFTQPNLLERLAVVSTGLWRGLGGGGPSRILSAGSVVFFVAGLLLYASSLFRAGVRGRDAGWLFFLALPQVLTLLLLQNPEHLRHAYPIVIVLAVAAFLGWARRGWRGTAVGLLLGCAVAAQGVLLMEQRARVAPPALRAVRTVLARGLPSEEWVFCGATARLFAFEDPEGRVTVRRARDLEGVAAEVNMALQPPRRVWVVSDVQTGGAEVPRPIHREEAKGLLFDDETVEVYLYRVVGDRADGLLRLASNEDGGVKPEARPRRDKE